MKAQFESAKEGEEEQVEYYEDWKAKKTWKGHKHCKKNVGMLTNL